MRFFLVLMAMICVVPASAEPVDVPPGSALRGELLDTLRPLVEYDLGAPVEFVVTSLQVDGDRAFARLAAQRPMGMPIDMETTPMVLRDGLPLDTIDGPRIEAFFHQSPARWEVVEFVIGATDVWWWAYDCKHYGGLLSEWGC